MADIPKASEARLAYERGQNENTENEWQFVTKLILRVQKSGSGTSVSVDKLCDANKQRLIDQEYKVEYRQSGYNESEYYITW